MADPFAPADCIPTALTAGLFWSWRIDDTGANPDTISAAVILSPEDGSGESRTIAAHADGVGYVVSVSGPATDLPPGGYVWTVRLTRTADGAGVIGPRGRVEGDRRSFNRRMLDAISATLEGRATTDAESLTIEGRTIAKTPLETLADLRARYARLVSAEDRGATSRRRRIELR